jgi:uncharacterized protein
VRDEKPVRAEGETPRVIASLLRGRGGAGRAPIRRLGGTLLLVALTATLAGARLAIPPPPDRRVNDYAGVLSAAERERLERKLADAEQTSSNQIVVAVVRSLAGESLEDYSIRLAQAWRIGQKSLDNGVIFLLFVDDRKMRIEVGYGLEAALTDATAAAIMRDAVAPSLREGRWAEGIEAGVDAIRSAIAGTYAGRASERWPPELVAGLALIALALVGFIVLAAMAQRQPASWTPGRPGWTVPPRRRGGGPGWPIGWGGGGGGGTWPSSPGGFGGGGGRFGGGGASGSW